MNPKAKWKKVTIFTTMVFLAAASLAFPWVQRNLLSWVGSEVWWQSIAAIIQAIAALAMLRATLNLVALNKNTLALNLPAEISITYRGHFQTPTDVHATVRNIGRADLSDVSVIVETEFRKDDNGGSFGFSTQVSVGDLPVGEHRAVAIGDHVERALEQQIRLPDEFGRARGHGSCPMVLLVKYRHSVTGQPREQAKYLWFIPGDNGLTVGEYLVSGDWKDFDYTLCSLQQAQRKHSVVQDRQRGKTR